MDIWCVIITWLETEMELFEIPVPGTLFHCRLCVTVLPDVSKLSFKLSLFGLQDFLSATKLIGRFLITLNDIIWNILRQNVPCLKKIIRHLEDFDVFFQAVACKWQSHRQLLVLSVYFSWDALKRHTSGIMMQRYNSMLSSSIILIFPSELIIHADNLMIFLEVSRRVEAMYVLFSYLIWKMATKHPYSSPWMQQTPNISCSWEKWIVSFSDQHKLQQLE